MSYQATVYRVLIGGPSDANEARAKAGSALIEWDQEHSESESLVFIPSTWEIDSRPELGGHPQSILNTQMVDRCDAMIAIFKTNLGTPTSEYISGTVEEYSRIHQSGKQVMIYLYSGEIAQKLAESDEYHSYAKFRTELSKRGLYSGYATLEDLKSKLANHLSKLAREMVRETVALDPSLVSQNQSQDAKEDSQPSDASITWLSLLFAEDAPDEATYGRVRAAFAEDKEKASKEPGDCDSDVVSDIEFLTILSVSGDIKALEELEAYAVSETTSPEEVVSAHLGIARTYRENGYNRLVLEHARAALSTAINEQSRLRAVSVLADALRADNDRDDAVKLLMVEIRSSISRKAKSKLALDLSKMFDREEDILWKLLSLEFALSRDPEDTSARFDLAYAYGESDFKILALAHYRKLLNRKPNHSTALNNSAAELTGIGLKSLGIERYERAAQHGSALAAANLAHAYIDAGFRDDAQRLVDLAKTLGKESSTHRAESRLIEDEESRKARLDEFGAKISTLWALISRVADGMVADAHEVSLAGRWKSRDGILVDIVEDGSSVVGSWKSQNRTYSLRGNRIGRAIAIEEITWKNSDSLLYGSGTEISASYGTITPDGKELHLLLSKDTEIREWRLTRTSDSESSIEMDH